MQDGCPNDKKKDWCDAFTISEAVFFAAHYHRIAPTIVYQWRFKCFKTSQLGAFLSSIAVSV